jgi:hypothetical protein
VDADGTDCDVFMAYATSHFGALLDGHGFDLVEWRSRPARAVAPECDLLYESDRCRLLFGQEGTGSYAAMAPRGTHLPPGVPRTDGADGWYRVVHLVEFKSGKHLLTDKLQRQLVDERLEQFEWLSGLLDHWAPELYDMFDVDKPDSWHDDFVRFHQTSARPGRHLRKRPRWWI